jgi:hypothetical protein
MKYDTPATTGIRKIIFEHFELIIESWNILQAQKNENH